MQVLAAVLLRWKKSPQAVGNLVICPVLYMCPLAGDGLLSKKGLSTTAQATTSCGLWTRWLGTCRPTVSASVAWTALSALRRRLTSMRQLSLSPGHPLPAAAGAGCLKMVALHPQLLLSQPQPQPPPLPAAALPAQVCPAPSPPCQRQQPRWHLHWPGLREKNLSASGALARNNVALLTVSWCLSCWHNATRMLCGSRLSAVAPLQTRMPRCITLTPSLVLCPGRLLDTTSLLRTL